MRPTNPRAQDADLAAQALPGHGVPSQDPDPAAQQDLPPAEEAREARSVFAGGGALAGAALGAGLGAAIAGPAGILLGGTLGGVAGALGAVMAGSALHLTAASHRH